MQIFSRLSQAARNVLGRIASGFAPVGRGYSSADQMAALGREFQVSHERVAIHKDMARIDGDDSVAAYALSTIASRALGMEDVTLSSFEVSVAPDPDAELSAPTTQALAEANHHVGRMIKRLGLRQQAWQIVRRAVKYGNEMREVIWDPQTRDIVRLKELPEHTMWPNMTKRGDVELGWVQRAENMPGSDGAIAFTEAEILHFAFGETDGRLGTALLKCARRDWKRLNLALDSTGRARLIRAFARYIHKVPVQGQWDQDRQKQAVNAYKDSMTKRKVFDQDAEAVTREDWPLDVNTDFFVPDDGTGRGGVQMLDPANAQLQNIRDILHFLDRFICATHVPKRYFPFEGSTPKLSEGGGTAEDKNFACLLVMCQDMLKAGYEDLFNRQLVLKGIDPRRFVYEWRMAELNTTDQLRFAQTQLSLAKAMQLLLQQYPEARQHIDVMLREYARLSAASRRTLSETALDKAPEQPPGASNNGGGKGVASDSRVTLPSLGSGSGDRNQV